MEDVLISGGAYYGIIGVFVALGLSLVLLILFK